ncbi:DUF2975 domain-containing protein [bacterium]|nr:DUF2975 domain-containing protein [bacterium]
MPVGNPSLLIFLRRFTSFVFWGCLVCMSLYLILGPGPVLFDAKIGKTGSIFTRVSIGERALFPIVPLKIVEGFSDSGIEVANMRSMSGDLSIETTNKPLLLMHILIIVLYLVPALLYLRIFRNMMDTSLEGRPFDSLNIRRLKWMGWLTILFSFFFPLMENIKARLILGATQIEGLPIQPSLDISEEGIVTGLVILALSAIFAYGAELEHERSLTV